MGWRLTDEYSLFYLTWIEPNRMTGKKCLAYKIERAKMEELVWIRF